MDCSSATKPEELREDGTPWKRVVIISTTFYPDPTVGAIRMTQWCRHLPELGWKPYVICRYYGFDATPDKLAAEVNKEVSVFYLDRPDVHLQKKHRLPVLLRNALSKLLRCCGGESLFVPDPSLRFWQAHRLQILDRIRVIKPDAFVTTSPPHSIHDIGMWLTSETGIPWIADFRDPYLSDVRFRPRGIGLLRCRAHKNFKARIYDKASLIIHAIPLQARASKRRFPEAGPRIKTLMNAFPQELLELIQQSCTESRTRRNICITGTIPEAQQLIVAEAVSQLVEEGHDLQLQLIGMHTASLKHSSKLLGDRLTAPGYVSHMESLHFVARADVLVNFMDKFRSDSLLLSTKLFEYLAADKPVLAIAPSRSDCILLKGEGNARILQSGDSESVTNALRDLLSGPCELGSDNVKAFRRSNRWSDRVHHLARWLDLLASYPRSEVRTDLSSPPQATIVITTRNRKNLIARPLRSALNQSVPVEVLLIDDGSTDGTADLVRSEFPQVRLISHPESKGYIVRRNEGALLASTNYIFSVDDDAEFSSSEIVRHTLAELDHPLVGAVAIPCVDVRRSQAVRQPLPKHSELPVTDAYIGTAHAVKRDVFLSLGGYREQLVHQGEEKDFCLRMLGDGMVVRLGRSDIIRHYESPLRDNRRMDFYGRRNDIIFAWHNVPGRYLAIHMLATTFKGLVLGLRLRRPWSMFRGIIAGYTNCLMDQSGRNPVPPEVYEVHRELKKVGALPLRNVISRIPQKKMPVARHPEIPKSQPANEQITVGVCITTRNRCTSLRETLEKILLCVPPPGEIIVCADGCTDRTTEMLATQFPSVRVLAQAWSGSVPSRDTMLRSATTTVVVSLDDDSFPMDTEFFDNIRELFISNPRAAVFTFPQKSDEFPNTLTQIYPLQGDRALVGTFTNSGSAFRRSVYLELQGFPRFFQHAYEEPDYALQCLANGYQVLHEPKLTIRHLYSPMERNKLKTHHLHARNEVSSILMRCPFVLIPWMILFRIIRQFGYACRCGWSWAAKEPVWWLAAARSVPDSLKGRKPVEVRVYWRWLKLLRHPEPIKPAVLDKS